MVVDLFHTVGCEVDDRLTLQQRSGCAVERVVCKDLNDMPLLLSILTQSVPLLTSLDLRGCFIDDAFLIAVANAQSSSLRRLYLPADCSTVTQSTLDRFTQLEELDVTACAHFTNVDFCSVTLRVLNASGCDNLTDVGLRRATRLEVLHVRNCSKVSDVSPFAHCLLELDASLTCGIDSAVLSSCRRLQLLNASFNNKITTLQPFAQRLRELGAGYSALNDAALAEATSLVSLSACMSEVITTVAPFGASLRRLDASHSMIGDTGLVTATNLVYLNASYNCHIRSLAPFSASLMELDASAGDVFQISSNESQIDDAALSVVTNLIWVNLGFNERITTLQSCGQSLRHLDAWDCALTNEALCTATQLVTLNCRGDSNLTTIKPFLHSLEEVSADTPLLLRMVADASQLRRVEGDFEDPFGADRLLAAAGFSKCSDDTWCRAVKDFS